MTATEQIAGWSADVERGPDWLIVRLHPSAACDTETFPMAEYVWDLMRQHFATRLVLELDELPLLRSSLIGQLVLLHKRVHSQGGVLRLASLSDSNQSVLAMMRLDDRFPRYRNRHEAIAGNRDDQRTFNKPR